ncbi:Uncharacterized protein GBIM_21951, partial [Gryllus bimaculatus]
VLGGDERGLHPHAQQLAHRRHDRGGVGGGADRVAGAAVRLEGPGIPGPHQPAAALPGEPGHRVPGVRHLLYLLRAAARHPGAVLENLPDGAQTHSPAPPAAAHRHRPRLRRRPLGRHQQQRACGRRRGRGR